eukprot:gene38-51_t
MTSNQKGRLLLLAGLLLLTSPAFADTPTGYDLGTIMNKYHDAATAFGANITSIALSLCYKLFAIDLAWALIGRLLKGADAVEMLTVVIMRTMWMGLILWVMNNPSVPLSVVNSFIQIGKDGAHTSAISPGEVFWQGIDLVNLMMSKLADNATIAGIPVPAGVAAMTNPFAAFLVGGSLIIIIVCFGMLAAQFAVAWIQLWFYIAVYPIALAFGVMKWTKDIAMKIITTPLVYGIRFLALYFVIAVGTGLASDFGTEIAKLSLTDLTPIWTVLAGSVMLLVLAMKVPTLASDLLGGTASMSAADGVGAVVAGGGAIAAAAGGIYAAGGMAKSSVGSAIQAGSNAISALSGMGRGPGQAAAGAAGSIPGVSSGSASPAASLAGAANPGAAAAGQAQPPAPTMAAASPAAVAAPPAPAMSAGASSPAAPASSAAAAPAFGDRATPPAPQSAGPTTQPEAPAGTTTPAASSQAPAAPPAEAERSTPPAPPLAGPPAPPVPVAPAAPAPSLGDTAAPSIGGQEASQSTPQDQPKAPANAAAKTSAQAAQRVLDEMQKTSGGGAGIQTQHGDE